MATTDTEPTTQAPLNGKAAQPEATEAVRSQKAGQATQAKRKSQTAARKRSATQTADTLPSKVAGVAEAAILVPVGATLEARDAVVGAVSPWTSRTGAEKEINRVRRDVNRFERRGNRAVRSLRTRYNRVLREMKRRRTQTTRTVKKNRTQAERAVKQVRPQVTRVTKEARERVQALI